MIFSVGLAVAQAIAWAIDSEIVRSILGRIFHDLITSNKVYCRFAVYSRFYPPRQRCVKSPRLADTTKLEVLENVPDRSKWGISSLSIFIALSFPYVFNKASLRSSFAYTFFRNRGFRSHSLPHPYKFSCLPVALLLER